LGCGGQARAYEHTARFNGELLKAATEEVADESRYNLCLSGEIDLAAAMNEGQTCASLSISPQVSASVTNLAYNLTHINAFYHVCLHEHMHHFRFY
jgi:uncharacterized protein YceH (UPF0502 family)